MQCTVMGSLPERCCQDSSNSSSDNRPAPRPDGTAASSGHPVNWNWRTTTPPEFPPGFLAVCTQTQTKFQVTCPEVSNVQFLVFKLLLHHITQNTPVRHMLGMSQDQSASFGIWNGQPVTVPGSIVPLEFPPEFPAVCTHTQNSK